MGLFDRLFGRKAAIRDPAALADFLDANAAFLIQKGMYEYSRARAGHYAKVLLREPEFLEAIERARWQGYPLGLAMVAEMIEGQLRPHMGEQRRTGLDELSTLVLGVFDRYETPPALGTPGWLEARQELARRLDLIGIHAVKPVKDIPLPFATLYFELMPIHAKLRAPDFPAISNYLRVSLINIHDDLIDRFNASEMAQMLLQQRRSDAQSAGALAGRVTAAQ